MRTGISFANCNTLIFHVQLMRVGSDTTTRLARAISLIKLKRRHRARSSLWSMTRDDLWVRLSLVWVFVMLAVFLYVVFA